MNPTDRPSIRHLYVHVPFCATKCEYCAFYSRPGAPGQMEDYVEAVLAELSRYAPLEPVTIFFGGGTPSLLPVRLWDRLLAGLESRLRLGSIVEWTIECNPATVTADKAKLWRQHGVNRISLGVQSFDDAVLATLGRVHTAAQVQQTWDLLRSAGFDNLNLDLMFGLPGQSMDQWLDSLQRGLALAPEHLATYNLTLEEDTEFYRRFAGAGQVALPAPEDQWRMHEQTIERLTAAGYRHYEISNFARAGRECAHNLAYWLGRDYLGLGPSACSTIGCRRWQNVSDTARYIREIRATPPPVDFQEQLDPRTKQGEQIAFGLRMIEGVPGSLVRQPDRTVDVERLIEEGLVRWSGDRLQLTRRGLCYADEVAAVFV